MSHSLPVVAKASGLVPTDIEWPDAARDKIDDPEAFVRELRGDDPQAEDNSTIAAEVLARRELAAASFGIDPCEGRIEDVGPCEWPVPYTGSQGLWDVPRHVADEVFASARVVP